MGKMVSWANAIVRPGGRYDAGVLRYSDAAADANIEYYRKIGGSRIVDRAHVPFAMTTLDTPILHAALDRVAPQDLDALIVDVGAGDGRNALPWLARGHRRVAVIDPAGEALVRLRERIEREMPDALDRLLLIEGDARAIPLIDACAAVVLSIEALYYLNEDYDTGLRECTRVLAPAGKLLLSERDTEGALLMQLLYYGVDALVRSSREGSVWDGVDQGVRTRSFSEAELLQLLRANGLDVVSIGGTSLLALILGWLNGAGKIAVDDATAGAVRQLLLDLGNHGHMRRCHVVVAQHAARGPV